MPRRVPLLRGRGGWRLRRARRLERSECDERAELRVGRPSRRDRRAAAALKRGAPREVRGRSGSQSDLHEERLDAVVAVLREEGARSVLDLGCGAGALLERLAGDGRFTRLAGVDASAEALRIARRRTAAAAARVTLRCASVLDPLPDDAELDAAVLVEVIEHLPPERLSALETAVFGPRGPRRVVVTTPNRDYNPRLGLADGELRHHEHAFEWGRRRFRAWAEGVAARNGYAVRTEGIGAPDSLLGSPSQMAVFRRREA